MPRGKSKGGTKTPKTLGKVSSKIEKLSDTLENLSEDLQEIVENEKNEQSEENRPSETPEIQEIEAVSDSTQAEEKNASPREENDRLISENANLQAQLESREKEIKKLNFLLKEDQENLDRTKKDLEVLVLKNEWILKGIEIETEKNKEVLEKIEEATKIARSESDSHFEKTQELIKLNNNIQASSSTADYIYNRARGLIELFRVELIKYIQMNGVDIKIDNLTDEDREIVAKTICPNLAKDFETKVF